MMKVVLASFSLLLRQLALLLATLLVVPQVLAADGNDAFRILYVELLAPISAPTPPGTLQKTDPLLDGLRFDAYGRRFELALERNTKVMRDPAATGVAYLGTLSQQPGSWARLTRIGDDLYGLIWEGGELYVVEPVAEARQFMVTPPAAAQGGNLIYRLSDTLIDLEAGFCSALEAAPEEPGATGLDSFNALTGELKSNLVLQQAAGANLRLTLSALGDEAFRGRYGTATEARDAVLVRLNNVDGIFSAQLGVEIDVRSVEIYDNATDPFSATTVAGNLLSELGSLRSNSNALRSDGLTHLFTGRNLDGNTVGIAYIDALCRRSFGAGLTEIRGRGATIESLIAAHEIGHNFGAVHDGAGECAATAADAFIMAPQATAGIDGFSACSLAAMSRSLDAGCITALPPPDTTVTFAASATDLTVGQPFGLSMIVANNGGQQTPSAMIEVVLPAALAVDDASVVGGSCLSGAGTVLCSLGPLEAGESSTVALLLRSQSAGVFTVTATTAATNDTNPVNNSATTSLAIDTPAAVVEPPPTPVPGSNTGAASSGGGGGGAIEPWLLLALSLTHLVRRRRPPTC